MISLREKVMGMTLGVGIGDALGMPVEVFNTQQIKERWGRVTTYVDMPEDHKFHHVRKAGQTTDDTQLTLAVMRAFSKSHGHFSMDAIAAEHVIELDLDNSTWGPSTRNAVKRLKEGIHWSQSGKTDEPNSGMGNGVVMKASPLAVYLQVIQKLSLKLGSQAIDEFHDLEIAFTYVTHRTGAAVTGTFAHVSGLNYCLSSQPDNFSSEALIDLASSSALYGAMMMTDEDFSDQLVFQSLEKIRPTLTDQEILELFSKHNFLVYNSLGMSYACFVRKPASIEALYDVVNMGGDTDSNGAIVGALLGALNGPSVFPSHLVEGLQGRAEIVDTAEKFCDCLGIPK